MHVPRGMRGFILLVLALLFVSCGGQPESSLTEGDGLVSRNQVTIGLQTSTATVGGSESFFILVSSTESLADGQLCFGVITDCAQGRGTLVALNLIQGPSGRNFARSAAPVVISAQLPMSVVVGRTAGFQRVLRSIRFVSALGQSITDNQQSLLPTLQEGVASDFKLKFGQAFNQKNTNWCWSYAAYHTMRTYYDTIPPGASAVSDAWKKALTELNTNQSFWDFMEANIPMGQLGNPHQFVSLIMKVKGVPTDKKWSYASQSDRQQTVKNVEANLRKGIPSAYCRSGHCVMIYGFKYDGTKATEFYIADSAGGRFYSEDASRVAQRYSAMWTQPISGNYSNRSGNAAVQFDDSELVRFYEQNPVATGAKE